MSKEYLLGIDFGGGSSKATLLSESGEIVASASSEYPTCYPREGWAEQNPEDSYQAMIKNIRSILSLGVNPKGIAAIALDGATHTAVLLDEYNKIIRPAIYWTDRRSTKQAAYLKREKLDLILEQSLNVPEALWTLPQLMWLRENERESFDRIRRIMFMKDYVRFRLTGDFATDRIEAMGSMLMDVKHRAWSSELCSICDLNPNFLPQIVSPFQIMSPLTEAALRDTGLDRRSKVIAGATDTVMEVFASGAIHRGQATVKLATAGRICSIASQGIVSPQLVNYEHIVPGLWYPGTATKSCAASYRWYRDVLCKDEIHQAEKRKIDPYLLMDQEAARVPAGSDHLYFHPYLQGEMTPYMDDSLRASFIGATSYHTKGHFNRAVMEGVAYSLKDCFETLAKLKIAPQKAAVIGGGSRSSVWSQILADILEIPLIKTVSGDSSLGSAMLAGVAVGVFDSVEESVAKCVKIQGQIIPQPENLEIYRKGHRIYQNIHDALTPIYQTFS